MQFAGEIAVETIERKERRAGKERASTFFAGAIDDRRGGADEIERDIADHTERDCVRSHDNHLDEEQN